MSTSSPQSSLLLRASDYRRMRWKNGAGWTSEILKVHRSEDRDTNDWDWRPSIAEIEDAEVLSDEPSDLALGSEALVPEMAKFTSRTSLPVKRWRLAATKSG